MLYLDGRHCCVQFRQFGPVDGTLDAFLASYRGLSACLKHTNPDWSNAMYHLGRVIDHVHIRVSNLNASRRFYRSVCDALHLTDVFQDAANHFVIDEIYVDAAENYVSRIHLAFQARSREDVDEFHRCAIEAGGLSNGAPGLRPYHDRYYAAFVLDPDGNNIEAVCDAPQSRSADSVEIERIEQECS